MAVPRTEWTSIDTDAYSADPLRRSWPWVIGADDEIAVDLAPALDVGESVTGPTCRLWKLKAQGEAADVEEPGKITSAATVTGTVVKQRLQGLEPGRVYRLLVLHGGTGNRRGVTVVIEVSGLGA